jgi:glycosyltransferase involved in cell wall biosynthesis
MKTLPSITAFYPSMNDAKILPKLIEQTNTILRKITKDFEIIVINDGSTDNTREVLKQLQKRFSRLRIIHHPKNLGYGAALKTGFKNATKEWVFYTDGDGQYHPQDITKLLSKLTDDIDVVNGIKIERNDSLFRRKAGDMYNKILHVLHSLPITDIDCDFRLIRASSMKKVKLTTTSAAVCLELITKLAKEGARFTEVEIPHYPRLYGRSQFFRPKNLLKTFWENGAYMVRR